MKRYNFILRGQKEVYHTDFKMVQDPKGDYVKVSDLPELKVEFESIGEERAFKHMWELLEKRMKMNDRKEKKAWRHDSCLGANLNGKVMEDKELLAELDVSSVDASSTHDNRKKGLEGERK